MGMVEQLAALVQCEHTPAHEHLMGALVYLVQGNPGAIQECLRPELNMTSFLAGRKQLLQGQEEYQVSVSV